MAVEITMPRLSDTMEEGTLIKWRVKVGEQVAAGDHLADVETDKATMELQAFDDGTVARLDVQEGQTVPVGDRILILAEQGESVEDAVASGGSTKAAAAGDGQSEPDEAEQATEGEASAAQGSDTQRVAAQAGTPGAARMRVSPLARKLADEHGVDLSQVRGSGPSGRIIKRDILAAAGKGEKPAAPKAAPEHEAGAPTPAPGGQLQDQTIALSSMRKTIARRLVESKTSIPHFTVTMRIDMDALMALRSTLNSQLESQGIKLSVNDFITRATALACLEHPMINASWTGDAIQQHAGVNVGVAVALPAERGGGLVVPVLRDVQKQGLRWISEHTRRLAGKAREAGLSQEEMSGGTITISNLGMFGVEHFEAIINPPQAAILAVGAALAQPVVRDGAVTVGQVMTVTLSADHRVVDGAMGAAYLKSLKRLLENPAGLLV